MCPGWYDSPLSCVQPLVVKVVLKLVWEDPTMGAAPGAPLCSLLQGPTGDNAFCVCRSGATQLSGSLPLPLLFVQLIMFQSGFWAQTGMYRLFPQTLQSGGKKTTHETLVQTDGQGCVRGYTVMRVLGLKTLAWDETERGYFSA